MRNPKYCVFVGTEQRKRCFSLGFAKTSGKKHASRYVKSGIAREETSMKHLLTGVAMAAALAIAAPVWAQNAPMTPGGNNPTSGSAGPFAPKAAPAPAPSAAASADVPAKAAAGRRTNTRKYLHHVVHHQRGMSGGIRGGGMSQAEQLNAQELQRLQSGAPPAMAPMPMTPGGNNPTSGAAGPFYK
jgi:hypothetical protein